MTEDRAAIECGMTEAEAECWDAIWRAGNMFFKLPVLHEMDDQEVAHAVHVIQDKLLSRPAFRKYLEITSKEAANGIR